MPHKPGQHGEIAVSNQVPKDDGVQIFTICCVSGVYILCRLLGHSRSARERPHAVYHFRSLLGTISFRLVDISASVGRFIQSQGSVFFFICHFLSCPGAIKTGPSFSFNTSDIKFGPCFSSNNGCNEASRILSRTAHWQ